MIKLNEIVNLNNTDIYLSGLPCGKTQNIKIKIGRKLYYLDIDKNSNSAYIGFYNYCKSDRKAFSKYDKESNLCGMWVENDARLTKEFFENIYEIKKAANLMGKYTQVHLLR